VCRRRFSVGADGLILIENSDKADFRWVFYNNDGSIAEMCGNGARCAARYAYRHTIAGKSMSFETVAGVIEAEILGEQEHVSIKVTDPFGFMEKGDIILGDSPHELYWINTGVPHAVLFVGPGEIPAREWGRKVRLDKRFEPEGTNANFVKVNGDGELHVTTYERGVENVTMACGTGVVASALVAFKQGRTDSPVYVETFGGEKLVVEFSINNDDFKDVYLQGPARFVFEGSVSAEGLL
jgi:diaminopimelate epimerase